MYPEKLVAPMRAELVEYGFKELRTGPEVESALRESKGTMLLAVNSICGCSAGCFRPAVAAALKNSKRPATLTTVFAGQDKEATEKARSFILGYPPSSPSAALFKDGQVVYMLERKDVEGHSPAEVTNALVQAFNKYC